MREAARKIAESMVSGQTSRPFSARFAGVCGLTGLRFLPGDQIRAFGGGHYASERGLRLAAFRCGGTVDQQLETTRPFDLEVLIAWLDAGSIVSVASRSGAKLYQPSRPGIARPTNKQLAARTRSALWMTRRPAE